VEHRTEELEQSNDRLEQRNAELAIINSVQAALAAELDIQGIYDAVGDKIREIFKSDNLVIITHDRKKNLVNGPYWYENGKRISADPIMYPDETGPQGFGGYVLTTGETLVINENMAQAMEKYGSFLIPGTLQEKASVHVPMLVGNEVRGFIKLLDFERDMPSMTRRKAFTDTVNSMSVALENARLFDETQRLFTAGRLGCPSWRLTDQQGWLPSSISMQLSIGGDKLREVFHASDLMITWYDEKTDLANYLYNYVNGNRIAIEPRQPAPGGLLEQFSKSRQPDVWRTSEERSLAPAMEGTGTSKSGVAVPIISNDRIIGVVQLYDMEHEYAYGESEIRLLTTVPHRLEQP
jgi:transcriptional regulator with GAF, ATPase, and Fis domain